MFIIVYSTQSGVALKITRSLIRKLAGVTLATYVLASELANVNPSGLG